MWGPREVGDSASMRETFAERVVVTLQGDAETATELVSLAQDVGDDEEAGGGDAPY